jgi:hypothetical protein
MKVNIGPYLTYWGPYQIVDAIFFWQERYPDDKLEQRWDYRLHDRLTEWLSETWVNDVCQWIHDRRRRRIRVHIDRYDVWSMDYTLSLIILPMLKRLKEQKQGYGMIDDEDVPEHMRSTAPLAREGIDPNNTWDWDRYAQDRYEWVLHELIWTFTQISDEDNEDQFYDHSAVKKDDSIDKMVQNLRVDHVGLKAHQERIRNGLRLFGKYYQTLWD